MRDQLLRPFLWVAVPLASLLLACMPLFPMRTMVAVIAIWLTMLALRSALDPVPIGRQQVRWFLFLASPFLLMLIDAMRPPGFPASWPHVERSAALLLFPAGFLLFGAPSTTRFRDAMIDLFCAASVLLALYANTYMMFAGWPHVDDAVHGSSFVYRAAFSDVTGLHPPYAAYFFLAAALLQVVRALEGATGRPWRIGGIVLLLGASLLLASRMPLLAFGVALAVVLVRKLPRRTAIPVVVTLVLGMLALLALVPGVRDRSAEILNASSAPTTQAEITSTNIRIPLAECTAGSIRQHWMIGTGQANAQNVLDDCYRTFNLPLLLDGSYGTHNQLLHWWLCFGLPGLLLFILYFGVLLWRAWRARGTAYLGFLVFLLVCMSTENLLARQWGVVLFACFNALFFASMLEEGRSGTKGRE